MSLFGNKKTNPKKEVSGDDQKSTTSKATQKSTSMSDLYNTPVASSKVVKSPALKSKDSAKQKTVSSKTSNFKLAYKILVKPVITEKATHLNAINKYVFVVSREANKINVARAIEAIYGVHPLKVNIMNVSGKQVISRRIKGRRSDWRKAIVTLRAGESIKIYEGV